MNTSADAPYLDCAYKLQEYEGVPRRKRSEGKATWPGRKQVWRRIGADGRLAGDVLAIAGDAAPSGATPLLVPVMRNGAPVAPEATLSDARERAQFELARLPERLRALDEAEPYDVAVSASLRALAAQVDART
jgi:nicotinate phosphoribosyltransferase